MPHVTAIYAAVSTLLVLVLAGRVVLYRNSNKIGLGDGGDREMVKRIRTHANALENLPLALLLLLLTELIGLGHAWLHGFGIVLVLARVMHAVGLSQRSGRSIGRFYGTVLTWILMILMALILLVHSLQAVH